MAKNFICDICGKNEKESWQIAEIPKRYRIGGIKDMCRACNNKLNKKKWRLEEEANKRIDGQIRGMIEAMARASQ